MIIVEPYMIRADGVQLDRTYSDTGHKIVNSQGQEYDEAIDPHDLHRVYTESENMVETTDETIVEEQ